MQTLVIRNQTNGTEIGNCIEYAATPLTRLVGLLGRHHVDTGGGLWINPSSGVHTLGMTFAIDVVGLDRDMRVVKLWRRLKPLRVTSLSIRVRSVLELAEGAIEACSIQLGDVLTAAALNKEISA